jgi:hypothetical protein
MPHALVDEETTIFAPDRRGQKIWDRGVYHTNDLVGSVGNDENRMQTIESRYNGTFAKTWLCGMDELF